MLSFETVQTFLILSDFVLVLGLQHLELWTVKVVTKPGCIAISEETTPDLMHTANNEKKDEQGGGRHGVQSWAASWGQTRAWQVNGL